MRRRKRSFFHAVNRVLRTLFARPRIAARETGDLG
jgi:hypothetical protein